GVSPWLLLSAAVIPESASGLPRLLVIIIIVVVIEDGVPDRISFILEWMLQCFDLIEPPDQFNLHLGHLQGRQRKLAPAIEPTHATFLCLYNVTNAHHAVDDGNLRLT